MTAVAWSVAEVRVLRQACAAGKTVAEIMKVLPHRSEESLRCAIRKHKLSPGLAGRVQWTPMDDGLLTRGFDEGLADTQIIARYLPHRTLNAVLHRRIELDLRRHEPRNEVDEPKASDDADRPNTSLAARSNRLLSVLATYHRHRTGELNIPSDGCSVKRVSSFVVPDNIIASHANLCVESG